jgi:hypothetical protein
MEVTNTKWRCLRHGPLLKASHNIDEGNNHNFEAYCPSCLSRLDKAEEQLKLAEKVIFEMKAALASLGAYGGNKS